MSQTNYGRESFSWLRMDSPTNLAIITGVISFPGPLDFERLRVTVEARLLPFMRFRQRVRESSIPLGSPQWELDPDFDLDYHLQRITLTGSADHEMLQHFVSELMSIPLIHTRPLWQLFYIDDVDGGSAIVARLHHCIADGFALAHAMINLADRADGSRVIGSAKPAAPDEHERAVADGPLAPADRR